MKFKTKIDWWVHLIVWCFVFETGNLTWQVIHEASPGLLFCTLIFWAFLVLMVLPIYLGTHYDIRDDYLCISCGLCVKLRVPYGCMCKPVSYTHLDVYKRQHMKYPRQSREIFIVKS